MAEKKVDIEHLAQLARLELTETEKKTFSAQLGQILGYVEKLEGVEVEGVEPLAHPFEIANVWRADEVAPSLPVEKGMVNAPKKDGTFFRVPRIK